MKASELRQNNWIRNRKLKKDEQVFMLGSWVGNGKINDSDSHGFIPIALNEEWLLKFGFVSDGEKIASFDLELEEYSTLSVDINGVWMVGYSYEWGGTTKSIKYVHQLQNLYFALTGSELTIK